MEQIFINGMNFQTASGKQVLFNGINVVCKDKAQGYFFPDLEKSFSAFWHRQNRYGELLFMGQPLFANRIKWINFLSYHNQMEMEELGGRFFYAWK